MMGEQVEQVAVVQTVIPAAAGFELLTVRLMSENEVKLDGRYPIIGWMVDYLGERRQSLLRNWASKIQQACLGQTVGFCHQPTEATKASKFGWLIKRPSDRHS
jgi:hypothetical protein